MNINQLKQGMTSPGHQDVMVLSTCSHPQYFVSEVTFSKMLFSMHCTAELLAFGSVPFETQNSCSVVKYHNE
jgi:hypothetical protein